MSQLFIVNVNKKEMYVFSDGKIVKTIYNVRIGKNGFCEASQMIEGGGKTPLGLYNLGVSFGIHNLNINYPYIKIDEGSFWVDDVKSIYYNCFVEVGSFVRIYDYNYILNLSSKDFNSAEHLTDYKKAYEYAIFIEYNVLDKIVGKGSAIFLHCYGDNEYTMGCIAIAPSDMKWIINFIDKNKNPKILIMS